MKYQLNLSWLIAFAALLTLPYGLYAQDDPPIEEEDEGEVIDYANLVQTEKNKAFCSSRILAQSSTKLVTLGYDFQAGHSLTPNDFAGIPANEHKIANAHGTQFAVNYPVFSKNYLLVSLGMMYAETRYSFVSSTNGGDNPLVRALDNNGLKNLGATATIFKPLNIKHYLIFQGGATLNGDYTFTNFQDPSYIRYNAALIYGIKANDRKIWGFGLSRTYLGGALNYVPIYYMMYTAKSKKWGLEMLLPARFNYRRNLNAKNLLFLGYEVQGNTFRINNNNNQYNLPYNNLELRRAELRFRASWEHAFTPQIWMALQAGYRYNYAFDMDRGDFYRPFLDDTPYLFETELTNPAYFNISINWVSP
ncbi:MAG: hypothetical protein Salg2KO_17640 [Salibacteraceae bacterium]